MLFDMVSFNAPYLPAAEDEVDSWMVRAWAGGANGRQVIDRFIAHVPFHLNRGGRVLLMQSTLANAEETLAMFETDDRGVGAHRSPARVQRLLDEAPARGVKVFIVGAGAAAHLAGMVAAHMVRPVIGVPIDSSALKGLDALLSTVQMPPGVPVATVSIGKPGAVNAAVLATEILAVGDLALTTRLREYKARLAEKVERAAEKLKS